MPKLGGTACLHQTIIMDAGPVEKSENEEYCQDAAQKKRPTSEGRTWRKCFGIHSSVNSSAAFSFQYGLPSMSISS